MINNKEVKVKMKKIFSICIVIFGACAIEAGDAYDATPEKTTAYFSHTHNIQKMICNRIASTWRSADDVKNSHVYAITPFFTHDGIAQSLIDAHKAGVSVALAVSPATRNTQHGAGVIQKLKQAGIEPVIIKNMHAKALGCQYQKNQKMKYRVVSGSANFTNNAYNNYEHVELIPDNKKAFQSIMKLARTSRLDDTTMSHKILQQTPKKCKVFTSCDYALIPSLIKRIDKCDKGDSVRVHSFTYNHVDVTRALKELLIRGGSVTLSLDDRSVTKQATNEQLRELKEVGADIVSYKIKNRSIDHRKAFLIFRNSTQEHIVIAGSRNLMKSSDGHGDVYAIHRNDDTLFHAYSENSDRVSQNWSKRRLSFSSPSSVKRQKRH
jgi:hypothetical protein